MDDPDLLRSFGRQVRHLRTDKQITQEELAHRIGRTVEMVSFIERGLYPPSFKTIGRLALALGVPVAELFVVSVEESNPEPSRNKPGP